VIKHVKSLDLNLFCPTVTRLLHTCRVLPCTCDRAHKYPGVPRGLSHVGDSQQTLVDRTMQVSSVSATTTNLRQTLPFWHDQYAGLTDMA
jgi:hypothetical protein